jgi:hypothetical protein
MQELLQAQKGFLKIHLISRQRWHEAKLNHQCGQNNQQQIALAGYTYTHEPAILPQTVNNSGAETGRKCDQHEPLQSNCGISNYEEFSDHQEYHYADQ